MKKNTEVHLYSEIGAGLAKTILDTLKTAGDVLVRINSPGGSVTEGNAIFDMLRRHKGKVVAQVDGLAASMASLIMLAGVPVRMAENALLMVHNPSISGGGDSTQLRKNAALLDAIKANMVGVFSAKTGKPQSEISAMLDAETWMTAAQAKVAGFIDEIVSPVTATACLAARWSGRFPQLRAITASRKPNPAQLRAIYLALPKGDARLAFHQKHRHQLHPLSNQNK